MSQKFSWLKSQPHTDSEMAQATWGKLDHYDTSTSWTNYFEIVDQFFTANYVTDPPKQTAVLISSVGPTVYSALKDAVSPRIPKDLSAEEINTVLTKIYDPYTTDIMERYRFYQIHQTAGQSITLFVSALRKQASRCKFGAFLDQALRDRFVCGLTDGAIQKRLLGIDHLPFEKAQKVALSMETAQKGASELKKSADSSVNMVDSSCQKLSVTCYCCGAEGHTRPECKLKDSICGNCGRIGHIPSVCHAKPSKQTKFKPKKKSSGGGSSGGGSSGGSSKHGKFKKKSSHSVKFMSADSDDSVDYSDLLKVSGGLEDPITVTVK